MLMAPTPAKRRSWSAATWPAAVSVGWELLRTRRRAWPCEIRHTPRRSFEGGADDLDARVGVVDPVDRHLADAQPQSLGDHEQLGVEEPLVVFDQREQLQRGLAAQSLEPALGVAEAAPQGQPEQEVVGP